MSFTEKIREILKSGVSDPNILDQLTNDEAIETIFRRVFQIGNSVQDAASNKGKFDYEVLENIGDAYLGAIFVQYLHEIIGEVVTVPKTYSNMVKVLLNTDHLSYLADQLNFGQFSDFLQPRKTVRQTKEDMFEAFVGAVVTAGNKYIARSMGMVIATDWLYTVFNAHLRDKIDPGRPELYVDYRTQINEIWTLNNWGSVEFSYKIRNPSCDIKQTSYNVIGPNKGSFPQKLRGRIVGSGSGDNKEEAKENASKDALENLKLNYNDFETDYDDANLDRFKIMLKDNQELLNKIISIWNNPQNRIATIGVRKSSLNGMHFAQVVIRFNDNHNQPLVRAQSSASIEDAIMKSLSKGMEKLEKDYGIK